jgi:predicted lactoylglutathione lyase
MNSDDDVQNTSSDDVGISDAERREDMLVRLTLGTAANTDEIQDTFNGIGNTERRNDLLANLMFALHAARAGNLVEWDCGDIDKD